MSMWTQDEAIAFEAAKECIGHWIAIKSGEIGDERAKPMPDATRLSALDAEVTRLVQERSSFHVDDHVQVARIRQRYGSLVREYNAAYNPGAVA